MPIISLGLTTKDILKLAPKQKALRIFEGLAFYKAAFVFAIEFLLHGVLSLL
jgi:hypothetical protein